MAVHICSQIHQTGGPLGFGKVWEPLQYRCHWKSVLVGGNTVSTHCEWWLQYHGEFPQFNHNSKTSDCANPPVQADRPPENLAPIKTSRRRDQWRFAPPQNSACQISPPAFDHPPCRKIYCHWQTGSEGQGSVQNVWCPPTNRVSRGSQLWIQFEEVRCCLVLKCSLHLFLSIYALCVGFREFSFAHLC